MSQSRIEVFRGLLQKTPEDAMIWYGLASEYTKLAQWGDAVEALRNVIRYNPGYTAAFQMLGSALIETGDVEGARAAWTEGIAVAERTGAWKAGKHMEGLRNKLPAE